MADEDKEQRTEEATPKRERESREKGQFAKSKEISSLFVLGGGVIIFYFAGSHMMLHLMNVTSNMLSRRALDETFSIAGLNNLFINMTWEFFVIIFPVIVVMFSVGILANILQAKGLIFSPSAIGMNFSKINPLTGINRLISVESLAELVKSIFKIIVVGWIAYNTVEAEFVNIPELSNLGVWDIGEYIFAVSFKILIRTIWVMVVLSAIDYAFQRHEHGKSLKMTKQEIKEESKETEGDPIVKARIKKIQREFSRRRMMKAVPKADVVITNPTHFAIALKYDRETMSAPKVIAKGAGHIALRIKEIASSNNVPVVENKPLAQMLFKFAKLDDIIPDRFYKAVAEILAYVYKLRR